MFKELDYIIEEFYKETDNLINVLKYGEYIDYNL